MNQSDATRKITEMMANRGFTVSAVQVHTPDGRRGPEEHDAVDGETWEAGGPRGLPAGRRIGQERGWPMKTNYRALEGQEVGFYDEHRGGYGVGRVDEVALDRHREVKHIRVVRPRVTPAGRTTYSEGATQRIELRALRFTSHPCGVIDRGRVVPVDEFLGLAPSGAATGAQPQEHAMATKTKAAKNSPAMRRAVGPGGKRVPKARVPAGDGSKRPSALAAAHEVLKGRTVPMTAKDMIAAMAERGLWKTGAGKTPEATLSAAIGREIKDRGAESRFKKAGPGLFAAV